MTRKFVAVPIIPTEEMLSAGDSMMPQIAPGEDITTGYDALAEAWPAMLAARPAVETRLNTADECLLEVMEDSIHAVAVKHGINLPEAVGRDMVLYLRGER